MPYTIVRTLSLSSRRFPAWRPPPHRLACSYRVRTAKLSTFNTDFCVLHCITSFNSDLLPSLTSSRIETQKECQNTTTADICDPTTSPVHQCRRSNRRRWCIFTAHAYKLHLRTPDILSMSNHFSTVFFAGYSFSKDFVYSLPLPIFSFSPRLYTTLTFHKKILHSRAQ